MQAPQPKSPPVRIVVIDDNLASVRGLTECIRVWFEDVDVRGFVDPHRAYDAILASPPALVFMDQQMPRCTGVELAQMLRERLSSDCPRLVLVSGSDLPRAHLKSFDAYFRKPFQFAAVAEAVERLLATSSSGIRRVP